MCSLAESESLSVASLALEMTPLLAAILVFGGGLAEMEAALLLDDASGAGCLFADAGVEACAGDSDGSSSSSSSDSMMRRFFLCGAAGSELGMFGMALLMEACLFEGKGVAAVIGSASWEDAVAALIVVSMDVGLASFGAKADLISC